MTSDLDSRIEMAIGLIANGYPQKLPITDSVKIRKIGTDIGTDNYPLK